MLRSFCPNCRLEIGPSSAAMAGCSGQHASKALAKFCPTAGLRERIASAIVLEASPIQGGHSLASIARPISSTTSSLAATKGRSTYRP